MNCTDLNPDQILHQEYLAHQKSWQRKQASTAPLEASVSEEDEDEENEEDSPPNVRSDLYKGKLRVMLFLDHVDEIQEKKMSSIRSCPRKTKTSRP